jgi:hypothetical protein
VARLRLGAPEQLLPLRPGVRLYRWGALGPELDIQGETLTEPFEISEGVFLEAKRYDWVYNAWDFDTNPSAPFSIVSHLELGGFYNGTKYGGVATFTYRPSAAITSSLVVDYQDVNDVGIDEKDFERSVIGLKLGYFFTPRISIQSLVQYSNQAEAWTANARFRVAEYGGHGIVRGVQRRGTGGGDRELDASAARSLTIKYTRQFGRSGV